MSTAQWHKILIPFEGHLVKEQLINVLDQLGIDSILEEDGYIEAFTDRPDPNYIVDALKDYKVPEGTRIEIVSIENKNWNAEWEAGFEPVVVGGILVRANFHMPDKTYGQELVIKPQMAFGTGHHETTYMMLEYMQSLDLTGKTVLDFGCGTGILSVYAKMQGSQHVTGLDIQPEAIENCFEHVDINNMDLSDFSFIEGDLDLVTDHNYDLILANINRHVLLEAPGQLDMLLSRAGILMCSGILRTDEYLVVSAYEQAGFRLTHKNYRGEWCLFVFKKEH